MATNHSVDDDSDEELGAYIYRTSRTAKLLREEAEARNNELQSSSKSVAAVAGPTSCKPTATNTTQSSKLSEVVPYSSKLTNSDINHVWTRRRLRKRKNPPAADGEDHVPSSGAKKRAREQTDQQCFPSRTQCTVDGCTNRAQQGGICYTHGGKQIRFKCSYDGCTSIAQKGGVCIRHHDGASRTKKYCKHEGCTNQEQKGGVCKRHGAKVKRKKYTCIYERCNNHAVKGGVCIRHGAKR